MSMWRARSPKYECLEKVDWRPAYISSEVFETTVRRRYLGTQCQIQVFSMCSTVQCSFLTPSSLLLQSREKPCFIPIKTTKSYLISPPIQTCLQLPTTPDP